MPTITRHQRPALFDRSEAVGTAAKARTTRTTRTVGVVGTVAPGRAKGMRMDDGPAAAGIGTGRAPADSSAMPSAPVPQAARDLLADASMGLSRACAAADPADRYAIAHLAALRAAASVLAARARPVRGRRGSVWTLMTRVAPEFAEWAAFFAAGSAKRQAVQAGLPVGVSAREADDLVRQVAVFLSLVGDSMGSGPSRRR